jgi:hypothetical protein
MTLEPSKEHPLLKYWRQKAADARAEADRIRSVTQGTDAEWRCRVRAEVWDWCVRDLQAYEDDEF